MKSVRRMSGAMAWVGVIGAMALAGTAIGQQADGPTTAAWSAPAAVLRSDGAIEVPLNAVMNRGAMKAAEAQAAALRREIADRPSVLRYDSVRRGGYSGISFGELNPPGWRPLRDGPWCRRRPLPLTMTTPGIGDVGFDPFNTFWGNAPLEFSRAATAGTGASAADAGFARAQMEFSRAAMAGIGAASASDGFARAQFEFARAASAGMGPTAADAGLGRAQAQFSRAAAARPNPAPRTTRR